jgi:hypothetical protein
MKNICDLNYIHPINKKGCGVATPVLPGASPGWSHLSLACCMVLVLRVP